MRLYLFCIIPDWLILTKKNEYLYILSCVAFLNIIAYKIINLVLHCCNINNSEDNKIIYVSFSDVM